MALAATGRKASTKSAGQEKVRSQRELRRGSRRRRRVRRSSRDADCGRRESLAWLTEKDGLERPQHADSERDRRELFAETPIKDTEVNAHPPGRSTSYAEVETHERDDPVNRGVGGEREPEERDRAQDDAVQAFPEVLLGGRSSTKLFRLAAVVAAGVKRADASSEQEPCFERKREGERVRTLPI